MLDFKTTSELKISPKISEQIIGQDTALNLIKKAAQHRRHVFLIGKPGTGKSLLGQAMAELMPTVGELKDVLCYPNEKDPNNPLIKEFPAEEGEKTIIKVRSALETSIATKRFYLTVFGIGFIIFIGYFLWNTFKTTDYGPLAIVQGVSTVIWILFIAFLLLSRAPGALKTLTGLAMIPKPLITHKKNDPAPFLDATGAHAGALLGDVLHDPLQSFSAGTKIKKNNGKTTAISTEINKLLKKHEKELIKKKGYEAVYLKKGELYILAENSGKIQPVEVLSINKYKSDKPYLIKITTESGKILTVTPEHKIAIKRLGKIIYKEAGKLTRFDKIVVEG